MLDIGWTELLLISVVALIVVGPKDLPGMFRTLGRFTGRMRSMAREFQRAMERAADESGVGDVAADLKNATSARRLGLDQLQKSALNFKDNFREEYIQNKIKQDNTNEEVSPLSENSVEQITTAINSKTVSNEPKQSAGGMNSITQQTDVSELEISDGEDAQQ